MDMDAATRRLLDLFEAVSRIPRCSGNEGAISRWLEAWAEARRYPARRDPAGNLVIAVPATPGAESAPTVILQGHMDMVCEKTPQSAHDFNRDPIRIIADGDWLRADDTTLGADNGVALALALAAAEDPAVVHPPLELLFTVEEETGLIGAQKISPGWLTGRLLINLDSEAEGVFTIGCAGGRDLTIRREIRWSPCPDDFEWRRLSIGGLRGGHSGIDIHRHRANATRLLARTLNGQLDSAELRLADITGGTRHNAIPRDAAAWVGGAPERLRALGQRVEERRERFRSEFPSETGLSMSLVSTAPAESARNAMAPAEAVAVVQLLLALPHGVAEMSPDFADLVQTSNNLGVTRILDGSLSVLTSQRSLIRSGLDAMTEQVCAAAALAGARTSVESEYPPWPPDLDSPLLQHCREVYRGLTGKHPDVRAIHAGLECAVIGNFYPGMDMISIGPTTENAHSPSERLHLPSLMKLWVFLKALLCSLQPQPGG
jgi:dipeptidase D